MVEENENTKVTEADPAGGGAIGADDTPYLKIAEHGRSSRTRALKLKMEDVIVAVDGTEFRANSDNLVDLLSSEDDGQWLLTIWRSGEFFEIFTRGSEKVLV